MQKGFIKTAALLGALSVILGAFAAHGLKNLLSPESLQIFETAVKYQFYHAFALLAVGIIYKDVTNKYLLLAGRLFLVGIVLFSGSLYLLCYIKYAELPLNWLGAITPFGGVAFVAGWVLLFYGVIKKAKS